jgi:hypothetical protein
MPLQNIQYREIINDFQTACNEHLSISSFDSGTLDYLDASAVNRIYPYVFLRPLSSLLADRVRTLGVELYVLDQPKIKSQSNIDIVSNTEMYLYDIMAWFNFGPTERQQTYDLVLTNAAPVNEAFQDRVYGWVATLDVVTPFNLDYCDYPKQ